MNYYNEYDKHAAAWLRELIKQQLIPAGDVDERSICDVSAADLRGYTQCHFFAGIGGWSYALQLAGWDSARPVWSASCPCQPFSTAGKGLAQADERHLWPVFFNLLQECRPQYVFGEQVASAIGHGWLDGVSADLDKEGYACGSAVLGAHSVSAPHQRQRLYWVSYSSSGQCEELWQGGDISINQSIHSASCDGTVGGMAESDNNRGPSEGCADASGWGNTNYAGCPSCNSVASGAEERPEQLAYSSSWHNHALIPCRDGKQRRIESRREQQNCTETAGCSEAGGVADSHDTRPQGRLGSELRECSDQCASRQSSTSGWSNSRLIPCRDGKLRRVPTEPAFQPLAHGVPARVVRLRGYGNAIVPQVAAEFIQAADEVIACGIC